LPKTSQKLFAYEAKRKRSRTNEPFGAEPAYSGGPTEAGAFVVHLHDARRRHYDLRLEVGGVLKSFAVPRGPSLWPEDKRLAVETEDHPIEYLDFEAVIPAGNYGAGAMIVWDRGRVRYLEGSAQDGHSRGKIDFELSGHKLKGRFGLVRMKEGTEWLLLKKQDPYVKKGSIIDEEPRSVLSGLTVEELASRETVALRTEERALALGAAPGTVDPRHLSPMLCTSAPAESAGEWLEKPGWLYELKLDGFRILAEKREEDAALYFRKQGSANAAFPEIVRAVRALSPSRVVLDGEVVAFDEAGRPSFQRLQGRMRAPISGASNRTWAEAPVVYVVFDLLAIGPLDLRPLPLKDRKALLAELLPSPGVLRVLEHLEADGRRLYEFCNRERLEGVVGKRGDSPYLAGPRRSGNWVKIKCQRDDDFVVVGWTQGEGSRHRLGALDLASYSGERLVVRGKVGSGLDDRTIDELLARLEPISRKAPAAEGEFEPAPHGRVFVLPEVVVNVRFGGWTDEGRLRHAVFAAVRGDVAPEDCQASPPEEVTWSGEGASPSLENEPASNAASSNTPPKVPSAASAPAASAPAAKPPAASAQAPRVRVSNPHKIFWPDDGLTKKDLYDYYDRIADTLLPYLFDRPVVLVRYPDGIAGKNFYQWNVPRGTPSWIKTVRLRRDEGEHRDVEAFLVNDRDTLRYIANLGCIPIHILAARTESLATCDFMTFDFDIGPAPIGHAVELALSLRGLLDELGLVGYPKTSGQSGLHVLVPLGNGVGWDTVRPLVDVIGRLLERKHAATATMERRINQRGQRVYIDTGQTGRTRTIVAPYSVRAYKGATVSTPLDWSEVGANLIPTRWSMLSVPARIEERGDPMRPMLEDRPDIARATSRLEALIRKAT
jgi:bifunctional non-homologous end joining protein LigD